MMMEAAVQWLLLLQMKVLFLVPIQSRLWLKGRE
jgi:hypothetical protein